MTTPFYISSAGNCTMTGKLTLAAPPSLSYTTVPTLTNTQIGYILTGTSASTSNLSTSEFTYQNMTLPVGVWLLLGGITTSMITSSQMVNLIIRGPGNTIITNGQTSAPTSSLGNTSVQITQIVSNSVSAGQLYKLDAMTSNGTATFVSCWFSAVRIA